MPSKDKTEKLLLVSAELVQTEIGKRWMSAFAAYTEDLREDWIKAPLERLQVLQGSARQSTVLLEMLKDAPEKSKEIIAAEEARKKRGV